MTSTQILGNYGVSILKAHYCMYVHTTNEHITQSKLTDRKGEVYLRKCSSRVRGGQRQRKGFAVFEVPSEEPVSLLLALIVNFHIALQNFILFLIFVLLRDLVLLIRHLEVKTRLMQVLLKMLQCEQVVFCESVVFTVRNTFLKVSFWGLFYIISFSHT